MGTQSQAWRALRCAHASPDTSGCVVQSSRFGAGKTSSTFLSDALALWGPLTAKGMRSGLMNSPFPRDAKGSLSLVPDQWWMGESRLDVSPWNFSSGLGCGSGKVGCQEGRSHQKPCRAISWKDILYCNCWDRNSYTYLCTHLKRVPSCRRMHVFECTNKYLSVCI